MLHFRQAGVKDTHAKPLAQEEQPDLDLDLGSVRAHQVDLILHAGQRRFHGRLKQLRERPMVLRHNFIGDNQLGIVLLRNRLAPQQLTILLVHADQADLPVGQETPDTELKTIRISSLTGEGMEKLEKTVSELFPAPQVPAGEILTNARQADAVSRAAESMREALLALDQGKTPDIVLTDVRMPKLDGIRMM